MDSGPNHLNIISLIDKFAGFCGFTQKEFDFLFADRLEETLAKLKQTDKIEPSAGIEDLKSEIYRWYGGYSWDGETKVLNPYSVLHFFKNNLFSDYWIQNGSLRHLASLIRQTPFYSLKTEICFSSIIGLSSYLNSAELSRLDVVSSLFSNGYLTIDEIASDEGVGIRRDLINLKVPNYEVYSSHHKDICKVILNQSNEEFETRCQELHEAFLNLNAEAVSDIFNDFFLVAHFHPVNNKKKVFLYYVKQILLGMDFNTPTELTTSEGGLALCLELKDRVYLIIELMGCSKNGNLKQADEDQILASMALKNLRPEVVDECLARTVTRKLGTIQILKIFAEKHKEIKTKDGKIKLLAQAALKLLAQADIDKALADEARERLSIREIEETLIIEASKQGLITEEIKQILTETAQEALGVIAQGSYHAQLEHKNPKKIIELGLAVYGGGVLVKAAFGPKK
jgi:hypothetical protein